MMEDASKVRKDNGIKSKTVICLFLNCIFCYFYNLKRQENKFHQLPEKRQSYQGLQTNLIGTEEFYSDSPPNSDATLKWENGNVLRVF